MQSIGNSPKTKRCLSVQVTDCISEIFTGVTGSGTARMDLTNKAVTVVRFQYLKVIFYFYLNGQYGANAYN